MVHRSTIRARRAAGIELAQTVSRTCLWMPQYAYLAFMLQALQRGCPAPYVATCTTTTFSTPRRQREQAAIARCVTHQGGPTAGRDILCDVRCRSTIALGVDTVHGSVQVVTDRAQDRDFTPRRSMAGSKTSTVGAPNAVPFPSPPPPRRSARRTPFPNGRQPRVCYAPSRRRCPPCVPMSMGPTGGSDGRARRVRPACVSQNCYGITGG